MKKVILIGDSIRLGYQAVVRRELNGLAAVEWPEKNGKNSRIVLAHLAEWVLTRAPAIVHLNCGLHDVKKKFGSGVAAVPIEMYEANIRKILTQIRRQTGATLIWATTTPVNEQWHHQRKEFDRFEADIRQYNAIATKVAAELEVPVNDLAAVITAAGRDRLLLPDGVHFSDEGYELLGQAVADKIKQYL